MIYEAFRNPNPIVDKPYHNTTHVNNSAMARATQLKIPIEEFYRRNKIVTDIYKDCSIRSGLNYLPATETARKQYGLCKVEKVFKDYWDFPISDEWPKDDHPYIITVRPTTGTKNGGLILCTAKWLDPLPITTA